MSETELTTHLAPQGGFEVTKEQLKPLCHTDNNQKEVNPEMPGSNRITSSGILFDQFHGLSGLCRVLKTNTVTGIDVGEVSLQDRINAFGENAFKPPVIKTLKEIIMENFDDRINQILFIAAIVSLAIGLVEDGFPTGLIEGVSIMIALTIIIVVGSTNNYISEQKLAELLVMGDEATAVVFRGSKDATSIDVKELVVGDLVKFDQGDKLPCDLIMVSGQNVKCDESALTGEPHEIEKHVMTDENINDGKMGTLMAKSLVQDGTGTGICVAVGENTASGSIDEDVNREAGSGQTVLQQKLETIADKIGKVGLMCAVATFFACLVRIILEWTGLIPQCCKNLFTCEVSPSCEELAWWPLSGRLYSLVLEAFLISVTVVVVAIPEGLPLAVTLCLSFSSQKMTKLNNLVRNIVKSEVMGQATHICSDKTGTLTENKMTTMGIMACGKKTMVLNRQPSLTQDVQAHLKNISSGGQTVWDLLSQGILYNSFGTGNSRVEWDEEFKQYKLDGNVTEQGIIGFFVDAFDFDDSVKEAMKDGKSTALPKGFAGSSDGKKHVKEYAEVLTPEDIQTFIKFTSRRKRASIVVNHPTNRGMVRVYTKGAPDMLFDLCTHAITADGSIEDFTAETNVPSDMQIPMDNEGYEFRGTHREAFEGSVLNFAKQAYRTILIAFRDIDQAEYEQLKSDNGDFEKEEDKGVLEQGLTAVGLFGLQDPLRNTIVASVLSCRNAGIRVIMCTGDNLDTACAISKNAGIVTEDELQKGESTAMTGQQFRKKVGGLLSRTIKNKDGEEITEKYVGDLKSFNKVIKDLRVLGRSSPEDKYLLVTGIQKGTEEGIVAVTGDGTNDAPALAKADVGFSMGITGTDVAKGASDIILLDDNFSSIIVALRYGRNIYDNVRKFLQFQLTVNVCAMFIVFVGSVILSDSPLTAVQMLWVNLIMDTFAALALATEPPEDNILDRMPQGKHEKIVTETMWRQVNGHAIYQILILCFVLFFDPTLFCHRYDLECFEREEDGTCKSGTYNPFYATELWYMETGEDAAYWEGMRTVTDWVVTYDADGNVIASDGTAPTGLVSADFDEDRLVEFNCLLLKENWLEDWLDAYKNAQEADAEWVCTQEWLESTLGTTYRPVDENGLEGLGNLEVDYLLPWDWDYGRYTQKCIHYTVTFQAFVFMQIFNQFNARKLLGEANVFSGVCANPYFVCVSIVTILIQFIMVQIGGYVTDCYPLGFTWNNLACFMMGMLELPFGLLLKLFPVRFFQCFEFDEDPKEDDELGLTNIIKKSSIRGKGSKSSKTASKTGSKADGFTKQ